MKPKTPKAFRLSAECIQKIRRVAKARRWTQTATVEAMVQSFQE